MENEQNQPTPILTKIIILVKTHKLIFIPLVPLLLFVVLLLNIFFRSTTSLQPPNILTPTPIQQGGGAPTVPEKSFDQQLEDLHPISSQPGLIKQEKLPDGSTKYTFASSNPNRPTIKITKGPGEDDVVFERTLPSAQLPLGTLSVYKDAYGDPEKIVQGSKFYGTQATISIYGSMGLAVIANPQTGEVFEEQLFSPMNADEYLQKYGTDN